MADNDIRAQPEKDNKKGKKGGIITVRMAEDKKARYWSVMLYPNENAYHKRVLDWAMSDENPYQGCYINHTGEDGDKDHTHMVLYFPNARSYEGVRKFFGKGTFRRFDDGHLEPCVDFTGLDIEPEITWICSNNEGIQDIHSYMMYLLHATFAAISEGKIRYERKDLVPLHGDYECINKWFELDKELSTGSQLADTLEIIDTERIRSYGALVRYVVSNRTDLITYITKNAYMLNQILRG